MKPLKIAGVKLKKGEELLHYYPFCYCIAKSTESSALFVIPPQNKGTVADYGYLSVCFDYKLCKDVKVGDWCEVGYISDYSKGENKVLKILKSKKIK